jgi:adenylate cyclase class 2
MTNQKQNKEIEVRFLEIDPETIKEKALKAGFVDLGEDFFYETIFYDKDLEWIKNRKVVTRFVRLRKTKDGVRLTYKNHRQDIKTSEATEIEFTVSDMQSASDLLSELGLVAFRTQEKRRHSFKKGETMIDIDTWPKVPTYVEIEGPDEDKLKETAAALGLDWEKAEYLNAGNLIEKYYQLEVSRMRYYTFDKIEFY